jgi:hypothetical protein
MNSRGSDLQRVLYNYIRVKVFDEKGKEKASAVDLPYREPGMIMFVAGRTMEFRSSRSKSNRCRMRAGSR